jgi:hypothetical protein
MARLRSRRLVGPVLWGLVGLTAVASGCAKKKATAIVVAISSEANIPEEIDAIDIQVDRGDSTPFYNTYPLRHPNAAADLPGTITLEKHEDEETDDPIIVTITAHLGSNGLQKDSVRVLRQARLGFVEEKQKLLRMPLRYSCMDFASCPPGETCLGGECHAVEVNVKALPDFSPVLVSARTSAEGCFDPRTDACFKDYIRIEDAKALLVDDPRSDSGKACILDVSKFTGATPPAGSDTNTLPDGGAPNGGSTGAGGASPPAGTNGLQGETADGTQNLNIAVHWERSKEPGSYTTLDRDPIEGWDFQGNKARLAPGICNAVLANQVKTLWFSTKCAAKPSDQPICPPTPRIFDSECFQCQYVKSCAAEYANAAKDPNSAPYVDCWQNCEWKDRRYGNPDLCPHTGCVSTCTSMIDPVCAANLNTPACSQKYGALLAYIACADAANGGLGDNDKDDRISGYNRCKSECDGEGYGVCLDAVPSTPQPVAPMPTGNYADASGHLVAAGNGVALTDTKLGATLQLDTFAPATPFQAGAVNGSWYSAKVTSVSGNVGAMTWPTLHAVAAGATARVWVGQPAGQSSAYYVDVTDDKAGAPGPAFMTAGPFSTAVTALNPCSITPDAGAKTAFCGDDLQNGAVPGTLYRCAGGMVQSSTVCPGGCVFNPSQDDACSASDDPCANASSSEKAFYCGPSLMQGLPPNVIYQCSGGKTVGTMSCVDSCVPNGALQDDTCGSIKDPCANASSSEKQMYCGTNLGVAEPNVLYQCLGGVTAMTTQCPGGCMVNDAFKPDNCVTSQIDPCSGVGADGTYCSETLGGQGAGKIFTCVGGSTQGVADCTPSCTIVGNGQDFCGGSGGPKIDCSAIGYPAGNLCAQCIPPNAPNNTQLCASTPGCGQEVACDLYCYKHSEIQNCFAACTVCGGEANSFSSNVIGELGTKLDADGFPICTSNCAVVFESGDGTGGASGGADAGVDGGGGTGGTTPDGGVAPGCPSCIDANCPSESSACNTDVNCKTCLTMPSQSFCQSNEFFLAVKSCTCSSGCDVCYSSGVCPLLTPGGEAGARGREISARRP